MTSRAVDDLAVSGAPARSILRWRPTTPGRWFRPIMLGITLLLVLLLGAFAVARWQAFADRGLVGVDLQTYLVFARRWLETGSPYLPWQLTGPYPGQPYWLPLEDLPSLYPPHASYLFTAFLVLPAVLWWVAPIGLIATLLLRWRPAPWTWPVMVLLGLNVDTASSIIAGNTTMWLAAFVAAGLWRPGAALMVTIKPSLLPFALIGVTRPGWWRWALVLAIACLPFGLLWVDYVTAVMNAVTTPLYSLASVPLMLLPVVAWIGRKRPRPASLAVRPWGSALVARTPGATTSTR